MRPQKNHRPRVGGHIIVYCQIRIHLRGLIILAVRFGGFFFIYFFCVIRRSVLRIISSEKSHHVILKNHTGTNSYKYYQIHHQSLP